MKPTVGELAGEINAITKLIDEADVAVDLHEDPDEAQLRARETHLGIMREMEVFKVVKLSSVKSKPITIKWVDRPEKSPPTSRLAARGYE